MKIWKARDSNELDSGPVFQDWPRPLKSYFISRGFQDDDSLNSFLNENLQSLKDPLLIHGMSEACLRLEKAFRNNEKICIYADFDLDGTSGCALLKKGLEDLGFLKLVPYQPKRLKDGYGFHSRVVDEMHALGVGLIITCDVGITASLACTRAKELGLDVIITDHHLPAAELPEALIIVNPNQKCDSSGLGYLSGAGVAFTLMRALKRHFTNLNLGKHKSLNLKELLDCFTIATLTDMVPLVGDNRVLIQVGLKALAETKRPGLSALLSALGLADKELTSSDVAIRFAPKLNALSRLEGELLPLDLFLMTDFEKAQSVITQVLSQNQERVNLQAETLKEALKIIEDQKNHSCHVVVSDQFHRGIIGLIATSLSQQTQKPCFVASLDPEEKKIVGSCRRPDGFEISLVEALTSVSGCLLRFGGHAQAAGFEANADQVENLAQGLNHFFNSAEQKISELEFDSKIEWQEINWELVKSLNKLEPFGVGFDAPVFHLQNVDLKSFKTLKGGHLKFEVTRPHSNQTLACLLFSPSPRQAEVIAHRGSLDLLFQVQVNEWKGRETIQLLIEDVKETQIFKSIELEMNL